MLGVQVQSLDRELRSHKSHDQKTKILNRNNIVTNSVKTLKMIQKKNTLILERHLRYKNDNVWGFFF